jgi:outer membrane receptor protein involved in Fe transport
VRRKLNLVVAAVLTNFASLGFARAQTAPGAGPAASTQPAAGGTNSAGPASSAAKPATVGSGSTEQIVVSGVPISKSVLPTILNSKSLYGLDLNVMDTPRNNTILTHAQLDALNLNDPHEFSYLTSSAYTDAAFGVPNVPRIRGQFADVFFNGMRDSFTANGYGAPLSFNSIDTIDIVKGPASVQAGPGAGVGGGVDISTKMPSFGDFKGVATAEFDSLDHRRWSLDFGGPIGDGKAAYRISYAGEQSDSYFDNIHFDQESIYGVVVAHPTDAYTIQFNSEFSSFRYTEFDGINRISQNLIDNGLYLTGGPVAGAAGSPLSFPTEIFLNPTAVKLPGKVDIDEAKGDGADAIRYNAQVINTYEITDGITLTNNTFFNFLTRQNQTLEYYSDSVNDGFTIENKTSLELKFATPLLGLDVKNDINLGITYRYAHVPEYQDYGEEPVENYDLTKSPSTYVYPFADLLASGGYTYTAGLGRTQVATPARYGFGLDNATIDSNLQDFGVFFEHRIEISPQLSFLYGLRGDIVQLNESDPFGGPNYGGLPQSISTGWYGLGNANASLVYSYSPWGSVYTTTNFAQYVDPNSNDGALGTYGTTAAAVLQQVTRLYEAGVKFNLLQKTLFISSALFDQQRTIPTGPTGSIPSLAHIHGFEAEMNYQPDKHFFMTASYSNINTRLDTPASFQDYPAQPGINYTYLGDFAAFEPNQKFDDPGIPTQTFNFLVNYHLDAGWGFQTSFQLTSPIQTTQSGTLNLAESGLLQADGQPIAGFPNSVNPKTGYYTSPVIPWQYTLNAAVYYDFGRYQIRLSGYNITNQKNFVNDYSFYGNDFITRVNPASVDLTLKARF